MNQCDGEEKDKTGRDCHMDVHGSAPMKGESSLVIFPAGK
jgi:hypothetical protein